MRPREVYITSLKFAAFKPNWEENTLKIVYSWKVILNSGCNHLRAVEWRRQKWTLITRAIYDKDTTFGMILTASLLRRSASLMRSIFIFWAFLACSCSLFSLAFSKASSSSFSLKIKQSVQLHLDQEHKGS